MEEEKCYTALNVQHSSDLLLEKWEAKIADNHAHVSHPIPSLHHNRKRDRDETPLVNTIVKIHHSTFFVKDIR